LAARNLGQTSDPQQKVVDAATDRLIVNIWEKIIALMVAACAIIGLSIDDLWIPSRRGGVHLHGTAAWVGGAAVLLFAAIPFLGDIKEDSNRMGIRPAFRALFVVASLVLLAAFGINLMGLYA